MMKTPRPLALKTRNNRGRSANVCAMAAIFRFRSAIKHLRIGGSFLLGALIEFSLLFVLALGSPQADAEVQAPRLALVIGNASYKMAPLDTPLHDAGLVAETLKEAGFEVTAGADLNRDALRRAFAGFLAKAQRAGPNAVVFVYLAGRGLQYAGDTYFVPVDAVVQSETDVQAANVQLTDFLDAIAAAPAKARIFVLDVARALHFATEGHPFADGLALVEAQPGSLYAFNAAPGTMAPDEYAAYGAYTKALVEMMRTGAPLDQLFTDTRLRVNQLSNGADVPWNVSKIDAPISFFMRQASAPALPDLATQANEPLNGLPATQAYARVIARDTLAGYEAFLAAYPQDPLGERVRALLAARREALIWERAVEANTPSTYWTYLKLYRPAPHFADALRRLSMLGASYQAPRHFKPYDFQDTPSKDEAAILSEPMPIDPPPLPPLSLLPPQPALFEYLLPPLTAPPGALPIPEAIRLQDSKPATQELGIISQLDAALPAQSKPQSSN
jgi:uncharacterized caspase-like protein